MRRSRDPAVDDLEFQIEVLQGELRFMLALLLTVLIAWAVSCWYGGRHAEKTTAKISTCEGKPKPAHPLAGARSEAGKAEPRVGEKI